MPSFGAQINLLEGLRHVHFHPEARTYSWGPGLRQPGPFPLLGLCLDERAYDYFSGSVPAPNYNYLVQRNNIVETHFTAYTRSTLDIITTTTAEMLGITEDSFIPSSRAGRAIFEVAEMPLLGGILGKWSYRDPVTQVTTYSHSMVYVAECDEDHVSWSTVQKLKVRHENTLRGLSAIYIPMN